MAPWTDAVVAVPGGVRLMLDATPGAKEGRFPDGFDAWRGRLGIRVTAPARDGQANAAVLRTVAAFCGLPSTSVRLEAGALDRRKTVFLAGASRDEVLARLQEPLGVA